MYKIINMNKTSFALEARGRTFKFEAISSLERKRYSNITDEVFEISHLIRDKMERLNREFDHTEFRKMIYKKIGECMFNSLKENNFFNNTRDTIFFYVKLNRKLFKMNGCPSLYGLDDDCHSNTCYDCRIEAFKKIVSYNKVIEEFRKCRKNIIIIKDYISGNEKYKLMNEFKEERNLKNKMGSFIDKDTVKLLCPRYLYLKDKGCSSIGYNNNMCIECWKEAKKDYEEGEEQCIKL